MKRYIDADKIQYTMLYKENWITNTGVEKQGVWKDDIDKMQTADVVEVVRCRDCRKREKINGITVCPIAWIKVEVSDDDFCSLGERAEA